MRTSQIYRTAKKRKPIDKHSKMRNSEELGLNVCVALRLLKILSFSLLKMNEEAKRSMVEWQEKLDRVTKDSEERISELRQKLAKVRKESWTELDSALAFLVLSLCVQRW